MSQPIGLVQLISEEAMPCLLPLLALKPAGLTHIVSRIFEPQSRYVMKAAESVGVVPSQDACVQTVLKDMPLMAETNRAVGDAIAEFQHKGLRPVPNFTGGTKLMSVGAFQAASAAAVTSLYVDGEHGCFLDGNTGPPLSGVLSDGLRFDKLRERLSVKLVAAANGCEQRGKVRDFQAWLPLGRYLLTNPEEEQFVWQTLHGPNGVFSFMDRMQGRDKWPRVLQAEFPLPPMVCEMAEHAGLIETRGEMARIRCDRREVLLSPARGLLKELEEVTFGPLENRGASQHERLEVEQEPQSCVNCFGGGWWEIAVAGSAAESGVFRDVCWSVEMAKEKQQTLEEDVLAIEGVQLAYFSCKRSSQKRLMRLLEEVDASARRIGGRLARKYFCVCHFGGRNRDDVQKRAAQLHIQIITRQDLLDLRSFRNRINQ